ncbi:ABC transporter ATP-binding protein [Erysipelothrix inopinata]|uniref:ABC transporter ATP-binding protein n=1 Tax=Erysipelothrix inopinata TaxID=225084 RepID=A0A7G9S149_9FIRM|nr:ABC transporter ATP-binding protein [Erysipelothrix inopinata]QNN61574.1 ABC transporter ATP-binding protein [Erysipelothrix inopinata]
MTNLIELINVSKVYKDSNQIIHALQGVDLTLNNPEMLAIIGPSGCGKSTLVNIIGLLLEPSSGTLKIHGDDISNLSEQQKAKLRNKLFGYVTQDFALIEDYTVFHNIRIPLMFSESKLSRKQQRESVISTLSSIGMEDYIDRKVSKLSGGERQRISIARAIVNNPQVIIADEPTGSLDEHNSKIIYDLLRSFVDSGKLVILVTHNMALAEKSDRILFLKNGKLNLE